MRKVIPAPIITILADILPRRESHATLDRLFAYADAPGEPPSGSKPVKVMEWLQRINKDESVMPLVILGKLIESYMEEDLTERSYTAEGVTLELKQTHFKAISNALARANLKYFDGGNIAGTLATPSISLNESIKKRNLAVLNAEFDRALKSLDVSPKDALSSACNIIESLCKIYIEEEGLEMPNKKDLQPLWSVVRAHLGFDPSVLEDNDLKTILSGLISTVHGIGSLRTHASSAHGSDNKSYNIEPRHARLAIHAAHTVVLFVLETWDKRKAIS